MATALYPPLFWYILATVLGACFGSFSNVLVYRLPRNLNVAGPRSFCPACGHQVAWYDNLPLLSWFVLRGKCRYCGSPISFRYWLLELAGVICALVAVGRFGLNPQAVGAAFYLLLLLDIALIDWQHMVIPHTLSIAGMILGLAFSLAGPLGIGQSLLGLLAGAGVILLVSYGYKWMRGVMGMGGGDVMLMGMVGANQGLWAVPAVLFGGALLGSLYALAAGRGQPSGSAKLPFGTFLSIAAAVSLLAGDRIWHAYLSYF